VSRRHGTRSRGIPFPLIHNQNGISIGIWQCGTRPPVRVPAGQVPVTVKQWARKIPWGLDGRHPQLGDGGLSACHSSRRSS